MAIRIPQARRSAGFTVVELAIVVTLAAVLVALATSAYTTFSVRRDVAAAIERSGDLKQAIVTAYAASGEAPRTIAPRPTAVSADLSVLNGRIDIRFGQGADPAIAGRLLSLTPYESVQREVVWICGNRIPGVGLEPLGFAGGGNQAVQIPATIEPRYLPAECR